MSLKNKIVFSAALSVLIAAWTAAASGGEIVRPEEIKSMRQVVYDKETYKKLETLWQAYFKEFPSEYAYANWMYAARYAGNANYTELLDKGLKKYPANPTLNYLKALEPKLHLTPEGRKYLEKAVALDPKFIDPWFVLAVHYMRAGETEKMDEALRKLLASGIIPDDILDYNYNLISSLEPDAIMITNGDNDTYPGWILTRILQVRPDITIVNRSLLNTEWYPILLIDSGLPRFTSKADLEEIRESMGGALGDGKIKPTSAGLIGDTLILKLIEAAQRAQRPLYFSKTLFITEKLKAAAANGIDLGMVTLVSPAGRSKAELYRRSFINWIENFRTGGLDSWRLRFSSANDAGRMLVQNYVKGITDNLDSLRIYAPELRSRLFLWYREHLENLLSGELRGEAAERWCAHGDIKEIDAWCARQGMKR